MELDERASTENRAWIVEQFLRDKPQIPVVWGCVSCEERVFAYGASRGYKRATYGGKQSSIYGVSGLRAACPKCGYAEEVKYILLGDIAIAWKEQRDD